MRNQRTRGKPGAQADHREIHTARAAGVGIHHDHMIAAAVMLHYRLIIVLAACIFGYVAGLGMARRHLIHARRGAGIMLGRDGALPVPGDQSRIELVDLVPALRIPLERRDHLRKRIAPAVLRFPVQKLSRLIDVEHLMAVARLDHP